MTVSEGLRWLVGLVPVIGTLAQWGGLFLHVAVGMLQRSFIGTRPNSVGALLLMIAVLALADALIAGYPS